MLRLLSIVIFSTMSYGIKADALELSWDWALSAKHEQLRESAFIDPNNDEQSRLDALLDVGVSYGQWNGLLALYSQGVYQDENHRWLGDSHNQLIVRELAWQSTLDVAEQSYDFSLGKIRLDYGVSYGYRPLDMFKPYRQNPIGLSIEEGASVASLACFDESGEWTLLYTNSHWTDNDAEPFDVENQQQGIGVRRYGLHDNAEYQLIAYYDDVRHGSLGASWVSVPNPAWEFHVEALWQKQHKQFSLPTQPRHAVELSQQGSAWQTLLGSTYTTLGGHSFIGEYWYDSRAWSDEQWHKAQNQAHALQNITQSSSLAHSYAQGLSHYNLTEHSILLHWSWDTNAWLQWQENSHWAWLGDVTPKVDLLISPQDGGVIATQWLTYQWIDTGYASVDLEFTARFLSGKSDSAYAQINQSHTLTFTLKGKF